MWIIARDDPDDIMPEALTDKDGGIITFIDQDSAWRYMETLCFDNGVPFDFLDYSDITLHRLH